MTKPVNLILLLLLIVAFWAGVSFTYGYYIRVKRTPTIKVRVVIHPSGNASYLFTSDGTLGTLHTDSTTTESMIHKLKRGGFEVIQSNAPDL